MQSPADAVDHPPQVHGLATGKPKFDADKDGALSTAELAAHPKFAEKFATLDSDKNGKLTTTELQAMKRPEHGDKGGRGRWHDTDKDGKLSTAELSAFKPEPRGKRGGPRGPRDEKHGG